jgi:hypothetical protein
MSGLYSQWQPTYAAHGFTTIPCSTDEKGALIKGSLGRVGLNGSNELAAKFTDTNAFGIPCGPRNGLTVLDVDSKHQRVLDDAVARHGEPRIIVRTASRKYHCYYSHNGERRHIRPWPGLPIDLLGSGFVYGPPSLYGRGQYEIIHGKLDDLDRLTKLRGIDQNVGRASQPQRAETVRKGRRNDWLWKQCMRHAHHCDDLAALVDVARTQNESCNPPLPDADIMSIARSAWKITEEGRNYFGQHGARFSLAEVIAMITMPDAFTLLGYLRAMNGRTAEFWIANGLARTFTWDRERFARARKQLIALGHVRQTKPARKHSPALYRWAIRRKGEGLYR